MKAFLKNYRQSPRKVRLVADLIKGKKIDEAISVLDFLPKKAGFPIKKMLLSAVSNASALGIEKENLFIKEIRVDKGIVMKRIMPAAMGSAHRINKRTSHINLLLGEKTEISKKEKKEKKNKKDALVVKTEKKITKEPKKKVVKKETKKKIIKK